MNSKHLTIGGGLGVLIAGLVAVLTKNRVHLTTDESVLYGGFALGVGTGVAHRLDQYGISGFFRGIWKGNKSNSNQGDQPQP